MDILPNSEVHLLYVPLENNYKNQVYFETTTDQTARMKAHIAKDFSGKNLSFTNLTYLRKENVLRIPKHIDELYRCNYVMYNNHKFAHKWFYAFITDMKYLNKDTTEITIETDVWQTWFSEITIKPSFVEREHVVEDTIFKNTYPEGLETGEYVCESHKTDTNTDSLFSDLCYVLSSTLSETKNSSGKFTGAGGGRYNGIYSGLSYYVFDKGKESEINDLLKEYVNAGQGEGVNGLFMAPKWLARQGGSGHNVTQAPECESYDINIDKNTSSMDGYVPKNKKLFCYPYNYLMVSNNNGANAIYRYEDWSPEQCMFRVKGALTPGCSIRMTPRAYKGTTEYDEESINLGKFPICNWTTDMYTNWMVKNASSIQNTMDQHIYTGVAGAVGGLASLDFDVGLKSIANAYFGVKGVMAEVEKQSMTPPQANGNVNCGDVITSSSKNTFHFYKMTIKKEYAEKIDNYFEMYGYKINTVKIPNISSRPYWNFVKTIGLNVDGPIPQNDLAKIREIFDKGITFWKYINYVEDYSLDNHNA